MNKDQRNALRNMVVQCRRLLETSVLDGLRGQYGLHPTGEFEAASRLSHLTSEEKIYRQEMVAQIEHVQALGYTTKDAFAQLVREIAFTHLNRLCAYKMMEAREVWVSGQRFRESVSRGMKSQGFQFYLADHADDKTLFDSGHQNVAYRHFLGWLGATLSEEIGVLFSPTDPANRLFPPQRVLDDVLALLNSDDLNEIWSMDETIGWVYQYFTPKELRDQVRKESAAPRNSYELAFRNQFFTPRYVVEFLTDNTLGRIWYEMLKGDTKLKEQCRYMVRQHSEIFLAEGQSPPDPTPNQEELSQEDLLKQSVHIPHRPKKDPRELHILDPACGSGHFLLYCFDLLLTIYEEAYVDPDLCPKLKEDYPTLEALQRDIPRLILAHNLHGIDIDLRASQIAALALWLRCQRAYREMGSKQDRPKITKSNIVCAEPMPGEKEMLKEFVADLQPKVLDHLVEIVFDKMKLAGEAGSLLKIEEELRDAIANVKKQWVAETEQATDRKGQPLLFTVAEMDRMSKKTPQSQLFDFSEITDDQFWNEAEGQVLAALRTYAAHASGSVTLKRQLFAEDAQQGFAFIDLCQKRFDVVLMNPPFGKRSEISTEYYDINFSSFKSDMGLAFVDHFSTKLAERGLLGALTSRTFLAGGSFDEWRHDVLLTERPVNLLIDLGIGVLDEALVETCAYTVGNNTVSRATFLRALESYDKATAIGDHFDSERGRLPTFSVSLEGMKAFPMSIMAYWLPCSASQAISALGTLESIHAATKHGVQTTDDFQFMRLAWEVPLGSISQQNRWPVLAKGGEYSPYFDNLHLCVDWLDNGGRLKEYLAAKRLATQGSPDWTPWMNSHEDYFKPGLTFPARTASDFSPRILPQGCVFTASGQAILFESLNQAYGYLSGAFTRPFKMVVDAFVCSGDNSVSGSAANTYRTALVNALPLPTDVNDPESQNLGKQAVQIASRFGVRDETSLLFSGNHFSLERKGSLAMYAANVVQCELEQCERLLEITKSSEALAQRHFGFPLELLDKFVGPLPTDYPQREIEDTHPLSVAEDELVHLAVAKHGPRRQLTKKSYYANRRLELLCHLFEAHPKSVLKAFENANCWASIYPEVASDECSLWVGCAFGRWNIQTLLEPIDNLNENELFSSLPAFSPAMTTDASLIALAVEQPQAVAATGVIPDDIDHSDDIVRRVRGVIELTWKDRADAIEKEACDLLGVKELRDYFRKPGKGGFWANHVSRYSKSRRNAPIYWLLQSSKKNYGLWLYYHMLDKDILFKARQNYVDPKIRLEQTRLDTLRSQKTALGADAKGAKKIDKEIEQQETLLGELKDFAEKLERAAKLNFGNVARLNSNVTYEPDLNDGVVLNIAPLWELVPWKEAKSYWEELLEGKYEWSSMGKLLRAKGLVK